MDGIERLLHGLCHALMISLCCLKVVNLIFKYRVTMLHIFKVGVSVLHVELRLTRTVMGPAFCGTEMGKPLLPNPLQIWHWGLKPRFSASQHLDLSPNPMQILHWGKTEACPEMIDYCVGCFIRI